MSNFLSRWSLRKRKVQQGESVSDEATVVLPEDNDLISEHQAVEIQPEQQVVEPLTQDEGSIADNTNLPTEDDLISINGTSNVSQFMATGVDKNLKKAALRKMFLNPEFAMEDEPNYSTPPKLDSETAAKLRDWMVEPVEEEGESEQESVAEQLPEPLSKEAPKEQQELTVKNETINSNDNEYQYVTGNEKTSSETKKTI
ncbi:DUF3306 domain-containing protein [Aliivibrio finisterrensis]|uniref:DUF3306 domain-containing protein n=1 Tax=Aliivibrio finisterrensis TaxID=511998 RepID=UPI00102047D5|nr:DUF3306 domain-containing protein [Aliivibrio finisterrensis]RYU68722.1 DUF3306 domain-containing protein [Aliivibrio finisterrensis]RYU72744.1 DUF3306 domain-containing protein [Aliivibrio finisterrensis]RYU72872.1 DUF3306 domain-containing protein [Aliivibrio finisterrensis]